MPIGQNIDKIFGLREKSGPNDEFCMVKKTFPGCIVKKIDEKKSNSEKKKKFLPKFEKHKKKQKNVLLCSLLFISTKIYIH